MLNVLDSWALELQQFNIKFSHIEGKKNVVADTISRLKNLNLYEKNQEVNSVPSVATVEDALENLIDEVENISVKASNPDQTTQVNLSELCREQKQDQFCKNKVKSINTDKLSDFILDNNGFLRKIVGLKYTIEPTIVIPKKLKHRIIFNFHEGKVHQGIMRIVHMIWRYFWWIGLCLDVQHNISKCKLCTQFLPNKVLTKPMYFDIPNIPFAQCALDSIGILSTTTKGNKFALTFVCLLTSYVIVVPLRIKTAVEVMMVYLKEILPKTLCSLYILQENGTELKSDHIISTFKSLGIKRIFSNPFYPKGNGRIENIHNFLKRTIAKFLHNSTFKWDDALTLAVNCFNIAPLVNDLELPFYHILYTAEINWKED